MNEQTRIDNVLKLLRRGSFTLSGEEALAFAQAYEYLLEKRKACEPKPALPPVPVPLQVKVEAEPKGKKKK